MDLLKLEQANQLSKEIAELKKVIVGFNPKNLEEFGLFFNSSKHTNYYHLRRGINTEKINKLILTELKALKTELETEFKEL